MVVDMMRDGYKAVSARAKSMPRTVHKRKAINSKSDYTLSLKDHFMSAFTLACVYLDDIYIRRKILQVIDCN